MEPIDQPFRPKWDFYVVWTFFAVVILWLTHQGEKDTVWYCYCAILILSSLFATIVLYGPVLLARQIIRSGSRGWFVVRVLVSTLLAVVVFCFILLVTGHANNGSQWWSGLAIAVAMTYLHWRLRNKPPA
jgi:hypothetical protein